MSNHDYTPKQALSAALSVVNECLPELHEELSEAINQGADVLRKLPEQGGFKRGPKPKDKHYWHRQPLTDEEALQLVFRGIRAYCVEAPLAMDFAKEHIHASALLTENSVLDSKKGDPKKEKYTKELIEKFTQSAKDINIEIEMEPEGVREKKQLPNYTVPTVDQEELLNLLEQLEELLNFNS